MQKVAGYGSVGLCGWPAYRKYNPVISVSFLLKFWVDEMVTVNKG